MHCSPSMKILCGPHNPIHLGTVPGWTYFFFLGFFCPTPCSICLTKSYSWVEGIWKEKIVWLFLWVKAKSPRLMMSIPINKPNPLRRPSVTLTSLTRSLFGNIKSTRYTLTMLSPWAWYVLHCEIGARPNWFTTSVEITEAVAPVSHKALYC